MHLYLSCLTLGDPMDCSLPGSSIHGILQARKWEWAAILFFRGFSWCRDWNCFVGRSFTVWSTREVPLHLSLSFNIYIHTSVEYVTGSYAKVTNFIKRSWIIDSEWVSRAISPTMGKLFLPWKSYQLVTINSSENPNTRWQFNLFCLFILTQPRGVTSTKISRREGVGYLWRKATAASLFSPQRFVSDKLWAEWEILCR